MALSPDDLKERIIKIAALVRHASDEAGGIHRPDKQVISTQCLLGYAEKECEALYGELDR